MGQDLAAGSDGRRLGKNR